jgi:hypothetical protein
MKKCTYPVSSLVKTSNKKIENFGTSKYQNKRPSKFPKENQISPPL